MATIIKLVLAVALLTASFQGARASMANYSFQDEIEQALLFDPSASDEDVIAKVVGLASDVGLPVEAENVTVVDRGQERIVEVSYTASVAFIPGIVVQPINFNPTASVRVLQRR